MKSQHIEEGSLLWKPSEQSVKSSNLVKFMGWLNEQYGHHFLDYNSLWKWSVDEPEAFWEAVWNYFEIKSYTPYTSVLKWDKMPGATWFEGATLNFAEHILRNRTDKFPAIIYQTETIPQKEISWDELHAQVSAIAKKLKEIGVKKGDRVAAYIPNIPEAISSMLAVTSIGAIWSSCSPDFGAESVIERFSQIEPKVLITVDGYHYNGKAFDRTDRVSGLIKELDSITDVIFIPWLSDTSAANKIDTPKKIHVWDDILKSDTPGEIEFAPVPFDHPLWVLYSSGTTGLPKPIAHGHGGMLIEHLKYMELHADVKPGDRFFWFSTTGWMMWNVVVAALLRGATAVLYDGSPGFPDMKVLWRYAESAQVTCFGTSATYIMSCLKNGLKPSSEFDLSALRSVGSTGSPLPPEGFNWVYREIGEDILLNSTSGGTDICSSFVGGNPMLAVFAGEIQCRTLGTSIESWDEDGRPLTDEVGEMVITKPMPCMPVFFWGDDDGTRYRESYFEHYPGVWRHGDWLKITPRGTCVIYGRSDATLNKAGVRIGTSEIYRAVEMETSIKDSLVVSLERKNGDWYMPLFVVLKEGQAVDDAFKKKIAKNIRERISPRFIPDDVIAVKEIPYTISGKKMEKPVKRILDGEPVKKVASPDSMRNPESLEFFVEFSKNLP